MKNNKLTASRLKLAAKCSGAFAHDHIETTGERAERGTLIHEYIAALLDKQECFLPADEQAAAVCRALDAAELLQAARPNPYSTLYTEQALYLSPASGEAGALEGEHHRDYSGAPDGAIPGTADALAVEDARVVLTDWKTGVRHESRLRGVVHMDPG